MKVLFVAAEAAPLVKVGGLADVIGSLPKALNELGHDVRVMMPRYGFIDSAQYPMDSIISNLNVSVMKTEKPVSLKVTELKSKVKVYLIDSDDFRNSREIYGRDELERFYLFCRAVTDILPLLDWQPEIVHCHDWHTGLIPMWLRRAGPRYATVFTIHNLAYQGWFDYKFLVESGLNRDWQFRLADAPEPPLNFISQGILWADIVTTVSETYAKEILTSEYGVGLDHLLRYRKDRLFGIVNGLDYDEFNPATDALIPARYDAFAVDRKVTNKLVLQKKVGLTEDAGTPLIGMVSRLDEQKGLDIVAAGFGSLFNETEAQMVILGRGREQYHNLLKQASARYPDRLAVVIGFDEPLAHLIYAGCDIFLMPSRFEPCGLGQLIAMRYGAVPVVRHTGGLVDTVQDLTQDLSEGNGFVFYNYDAKAMLAAIQRALNSYKNKEAWQRLMRRIMAIDFSWRASARKYESLYRRVLELRNHG